MVAVLTHAPGNGGFAPQGEFSAAPVGRPGLHVVPSARPSRAVYLRRRVVSAVVGVLVVALLAWFVTSLASALDPQVASSHLAESAAAADDGGLAGAVDIVVAQPGDSFWSIARRIQPSGDIRPLVQLMTELNGGPGLVAGQAVRLP